MTFNWWTAFFVFTSYVIIDMLYVIYFVFVEKRQAVRAALTGSFMYSLMAYGVIAYSDNKLYLIPLLLGSFIGTYLTVRFHHNVKTTEL